MPQTESQAQDRRSAPTLESVLVVVQIAQLSPTLNVSDLLGRMVTNDADEEIGRLDDLMITDDRLVFAVLSVGGFLGVGAHQVVVAFEDLSVDDEAIVLPGATKAALKQMCAYDRAEVERHRGRRRARHEAGEVAETALGEPVLGAVSDVADGDR